MDSQLVPPVCATLIPGISDDVVLCKIATKLPWTMSRILSSVNRSWHQAFESKEVYNARRSFQAVETLVAMKLWKPSNDFLRTFASSTKICLYSTRQSCFYRLPPIPDHIETANSSMISVEGMIYIFGGGDNCRNPRNQQLHVVDVFGQREWMQRASMSRKRHGFKCGVLYGKIFVLGGIAANHRCFCHSEVYDPKLDNWSLIKPMFAMGAPYQVIRVGNELFVQGRTNIRVQKGECSESSWQVYNPVRNEWRILGPSMMGPLNMRREKLFMVQGKFCWITPKGLHSYDVHDSSYTCRPSRLGDAIRPNANVTIREEFIILVDSELLAMVRWRVDREYGENILQSKGFSESNEEIMWEMLPFPDMRSSMSFGDMIFPMCFVEL